jgi:hypothetical protein
MSNNNQFLFIELNQNALQDGRAFDGVAFGTFRDMLGREITLDADDAGDYVANTTLAIEATRTDSGELVGLPIDAQGHDKGDGAGWIVGVELVGDIIRLVPKWTKIGRELIGEGIRRFFSATIDTSNKVVLGGTLTNWPATRDENNRMMLKPIELERGIFTVDELETEPESSDAPIIISEEENMPDEILEDEGEVIVEAVTQPEPTPELAELPPDLTAELMQQVRAAGEAGPAQLTQIVNRIADQQADRRLAQLVDADRRKWEITELAAKLTGNGERALPVKVATITDFLLSLDPEQFVMAKSIFETISQNGLIEFTEMGHGRRLRKQPLPQEYHDMLRRTIKAGNDVDEFFNLAGLSDPSDYDLSQFEENK